MDFYIKEDFYVDIKCVIKGCVDFELVEILVDNLRVVM